MWYVCDVLYAVLYVCVSCFAMSGCVVSRRYINVCNCDMFSVVCIDGRRYVCCSECYVVSNECDELTPCLVRPIDTCVGGLDQCLEGWCGVMSVWVVSQNCLCILQVKVSVYCARRIP